MMFMSILNCFAKLSDDRLILKFHDMTHYNLATEISQIVRIASHKKLELGQQTK